MNKMWMKTAAIMVLLVSTAFLLHKRGDREIIVSHQPLSQFPISLGTQWDGRAIAIDPRVIEVLGAGDFVERSYQRIPSEPPVDLFLGYFPSQRTGVSIHSPKNCLPGSGWAPIDSKHISLPLGSGREYRVNEYVIQKGDQEQVVLYWYQAHGRLVANEYVAKFYQVADSIRLGRSDAALVRIVTPIMVGREGSAQAEKRALEFATTLMPTLETYIPS